MKNVVLNTIGGVVLVEMATEDDRLYCIEDLAKSNELTIGHIFRAVRVLYGKEPADYGILWPKFKTADKQVSNHYIFIQEAFKKCENDLERFFLACDELREEKPEVIPRKEVEVKLALFKELMDKGLSN